jgi:predicted MPP superfamily phosphohydrolase
LRRRAGAAVAAALGLGAVLVYGGCFEARRVVLERVVVPGAGPRLRIGQISDVDFRRTGVRERRARDLMRDEVQPDLLVVTGDLVELRGAGPADRLGQAIAWVETIPSPRGAFWVAGESEARNLELVRGALAGRRLRLLFNDEVRFEVEGREVSLFGLGKNHARWTPARAGGRPVIRARSTALFSPLVDAAGGAEGWRDYDLAGDLRFEDVDDYVGALAYVPAGRPDVGYGLVRHVDEPAFHLRKFGGGAALATGRAAGPPALPGVWYRYRLRVETLADHNRIRARTWRGSEAEPAGWQLEAIDPDPGRPLAGAAGVCVKGGGDERYFGAWVVEAVRDGALLARLDPGQFRLDDGSWRFLSVLRDWAPPGGRERPYRILLAHNPDVLLDLEAHGAGAVDLVLAGHTQGGQVRLPWFGAVYTGTEIGRAYASGLARHDDGYVYVNRGLGMSLVPIRILCPPEVTALEVAVGGAGP